MQLLVANRNIAKRVIQSIALLFIVCGCNKADFYAPYTELVVTLSSSKLESPLIEIDTTITAYILQFDPNDMLMDAKKVKNLRNSSENEVTFSVLLTPSSDDSEKFSFITVVGYNSEQIYKLLLEKDRSYENIYNKILSNGKEKRPQNGSSTIMWGEISDTVVKWSKLFKSVKLHT